MAHPLIEEHWPALGELERTLDRLTAQPHEIKVKEKPEQSTEDEQFARFIARLNRPGGPKISSRAIV